MKADIEELVEGVIDKAQMVSGIDITHDELGLASGFHEANEIKDALADYVLQLVSETKKYGEKVNEVLMRESLQHMANSLNNQKKFIDQISSVVEKGIHDPGYPDQRLKLIQQIKNGDSALRKALIPYEQELKMNDLLQKVSSVDYAKNEVDEIEKIKDSVKRSASETEKILSNLQTKAMRSGVEESASSFAALKENHQFQERLWFFVFLVSSALTIWAFIHAINTEFSSDDIFKAVATIVKKVMLITVPAIFMRIALTKFNLERNLRITYDHRESVLSQYKNFENAIGDDADAKNEFRLELAKYVFSDPQTGYLGKNANEIGLSINPIVNMVDKAGKAVK